MRKSKILKALLAFGMSAATALSVAGVTACGHSHTFSEDWSTDKDNHWHAATCEHTDEVDGKEAHKDDNKDNKCDVCGYVLSTGGNQGGNQGGNTEEHVHTFDETTWNNTQPDGHWHPATCEHVAERGDSFAPHVDEDTDGDCDVCGYTYEISDKYKELLKQEGSSVVLANTFFTSGKLSEFASWGTAGIYQARKGETTADTHYVDIKDGKATLVTTAAAATYMPVDFGNVNGSVVEGFFVIKDVDGTNGYTPIQFVNVSGSTEKEVFGLRSSKDADWKYRVDGGSDVTIKDFGIKWINGGKVYFKFDTTTNKLTVKIDDKDFVTDLQLSAGINGIKFSSGDTNTSTYSVDDLIVVKTALSIDVYKTATTAKVSAVETAVSGLDISSDKATVTTEIEAATTLDECDAAYNKFYASVLAKYKTSETTAQNAKYVGKYTVEQNKEAYEAAKTAGEAAIDGATTIEAVKSAVTAWDTAMSAVKDDAYYNKQDVVITVANGKTDANTLTVKEGDQVTKAQLDALVDLSGGKSVVGYYTDAECTSVNEVSLPLTASSAISIYAKTEVVSSAKWFTEVAGSAGNVKTTSYAVGDVIEDNALFSISTLVAMQYSAGGTYGNISGTNATTYTNVAGETVKPDQGIKSGSNIEKNASVDTLKITAKTATTIRVYINIVNDSYNSNRTGGTISYKVNGGEAVSTAAVARKGAVVVLEIAVQAGDEVIVTGAMDSSNTGKIWLFGAETK